MIIDWFFYQHETSTLWILLLQHSFCKSYLKVGLIGAYDFYYGVGIVCIEVISTKFCQLKYNYLKGSTKLFW